MYEAAYIGSETQNTQEEPVETLFKASSKLRIGSGIIDCLGNLELSSERGQGFERQEGIAYTPQPCAVSVPQWKYR